MPSYPDRPIESLIALLNQIYNAHYNALNLIAIDLPRFNSAEIGAVNAFTLVVTFDRAVSASNYAAGVTIKVNGTATSITSAARQSNHAIVRYVIPVLWHGSGDAVTWEYASASGNIIAESGGAALGNVSAQAVTNNCEYSTLLGSDLQADTGVSQSGGSVSAWSDQTPNGTHHFAQSNASYQPAFLTIGGYPAINFVAGGNTGLVGSNFFDNLDQFTIVYVARTPAGYTAYPYIIWKEDLNIGNGWDTAVDGEFTIWKDYNNLLTTQAFHPAPIDNTWRVISNEKISNTEVHIYLNSVRDDTLESQGTINTISTIEPVTIGTPGLPWADYAPFDVRAFMLFSPIPNAVNRAALEARLAARYGITL